MTFDWLNARGAISLVALLTTVSAQASPNVSLDEPIYEELAWLRAIGRLPAYQGGFRPISAERARALKVAAGLGDGLAPERGWWISPLSRLRARAGGWRDDSRPYSTVIRPRLLAGTLSVSCEHGEGGPCGDGVAAWTELDTAAGYGPWLSGAARIRAQAGTSSYDETIAVDRAYVSTELAGFAAEVGRDVVGFGPSSRSQLGWGDHAPPLDHVRVSTAEPYRLAGWLHASGHYVVGQLRAPQRYPGTLVTIGRLQLDLGNAIELGAIQLLQLGGDGAPAMDVWDFIAEHVRRRDSTASGTDSSNRRFGGDLAVRVAELDGARFYYQLIFEDIRRKRLIDAVRYDADHLFGLELAALGPGRRHGLTVEWQRTGVRSHEHAQRTTGFTSAARNVGSPLGPDAQSLFVGARLALGRTTVSPWLELAELSSDSYEFIVDGPINRISEGATEARYRAGARVRVMLEPGWWVDGEAVYEHVDRFGFDPAATRNNVGVLATVVWHPAGRVGRLATE